MFNFMNLLGNEELELDISEKFNDSKIEMLLKRAIQDRDKKIEKYENQLELLKQQHKNQLTELIEENYVQKKEISALKEIICQNMLQFSPGSKKKSEQSQNLKSTLSTIIPTPPKTASPYTTDAEISVVMNFQDHTKKPWGFTVNFNNQYDNWVILGITAGGQAEQVGVRLADRISKVNDVELNQNTYRGIMIQLRRGIACTILFIRSKEVTMKALTQFKQGSRIAYKSNHNWKEGYVSGINPNGEIQIITENGKSIETKDVRPSRKLHVGEMIRYYTKTGWFDGKIASVNTKNTYDIIQKNGATAKNWPAHCLQPIKRKQPHQYQHQQQRTVFGNVTNTMNNNTIMNNSNTSNANMSNTY